MLLRFGKVYMNFDYFLAKRKVILLAANSQ